MGRPWGGTRVTQGRGGPVVVALGALVAGVFAAWLAWGPGRLPAGIPHLVAGWTLAGTGVLVWWRVGWSRVGPLLAAAGLLWFAGDLDGCLNIEPVARRCLDPGALGDLAGAAAWLWLGPVAWVLATWPDGRAEGWLERGLVVAGWLVALAVPLSAAVSWAAAALLLATPLTRLVAVDRSVRGVRLATLPAGIAMAVAVLEPAPISGPTIDLLVALAAAGLGTALLAEDRRRAALTADRVLALGEALAAAIGDPVLRVVYRGPGGHGWVDGEARPAPPPRTGRVAVVEVQHDGHVLAAVEHDPALLSGPVRAAVLLAVGLAAHNVRLRAELQDRVAAVDASRRRLAVAAVDERRALGARVDAEVGSPMDALAARIRSLGQEPGRATGETARGLAEATAELDRARAEVAELAAGLYPAALATAGLSRALADLGSAGGPGLRVDVAVDPGLRAAPVIDATAWFVVTEALANARRHAAASTVWITARLRDGRLHVQIRDDGMGGADPEAGSGLLGVRDRVRAVGGELLAVSSPGAGTTVSAWLPLDGAARVAP